MSRAGAVAAALAARDLDAVVVTAPANVRWLTGFTGSSAIAVVGAGPSGARDFLTDFRYDEQSAQQLDPEWARHISPDIAALTAELIRDTGAAGGSVVRVGFDDRLMPVADHARLAERTGEQVEHVAAGGLIEELRAVKDATEVAAIAAATELADAALETVLGDGLIGRTEVDVARELEFAMRRAGASGPSFPPIVASGAHGALPHAAPRPVPIEAGQLVTIDWGAQAGGYASDCTRTFATGTVSPQLVEIYEVTLAAQEAALAAVRSGAGGREVDEVARGIIADAGYGERFGHGLGHGVGIEIHEGPRLSARSDDTLVAGNVVTVEPGIYLPGVGGVRIEDLVVVTDDGADVLTHMDKALRIVG